MRPTDSQSIYKAYALSRKPITEEAEGVEIAAEDEECTTCPEKTPPSMDDEYDMSDPVEAREVMIGKALLDLADDNCTDCEEGQTVSDKLKQLAQELIDLHTPKEDDAEIPDGEYIKQ